MDCPTPPEIPFAAPLNASHESGTTVRYACTPPESMVLVDGPPDVTCDCSNTSNITLTGNSGVLTSPGYPGNHADFLDCFYVISLDQPGPQAVTATVEYNVEVVADCIFDYFIINDDGEKYCGTGNFTKVFLVAGNQWSVHFYADYADNNARAFRIEYNV
ncbi:blastula protease 10-like [Littorina saxatilis]|uniref:blastula protease 10-like n=1 Tax=Littorina saxatilis TaxID=31220 RepID=UPI0038B64024